MTLVIVLNALLVVFVLATIAGLHVWAIVSSRDQPPAVAEAGTPQTATTPRRRRQTAARRPGSALALR